MKQLCLVKRGKENMCHRYDERKVYGSVYAACYVVRIDEDNCEKIANQVAKHVTAVTKNKKKITSSTIAKIAAAKLRKHNKHAAFMYETHRDIS